MTKALDKEGSFAEGPSNGPRQRFFLKKFKKNYFFAEGRPSGKDFKKILKISLPSATEEALGKGFFKKIQKKLFLCRGSVLSKQIFFKKKPLPRALVIALGKDFFGKNPEKFFAEGQGGGPRQRFFKK